MLQRRSLLKTTLLGAATAVSPQWLLAAEKPRFKLFDTHAHFYTNDPDKYPFNASGARNGAEKTIAKAMANPMTPETVFRLWDADNIERGCGVQYNSTYASDNRYLLDIAARHKDRIVPVVILPPTDASTPDTLVRMTRANRISGVRFTGGPNAAGDYVFLSDAAKATWEAANDLGLVIVLMPTSEQAPKAMRLVGEFADRYPNVNIVLDHIGFPRQEASATFGFSPEHLALAAHKNVYYKYTTLLIERLQAAKIPANVFVDYVAGVFGTDHLVWGSDLGNSEGQFSDFVHHALESAKGLTQAQQQALFHDTAQGLFIAGGRGASAHRA